MRPPVLVPGGRRQRREECGPSAGNVSRPDSRTFSARLKTRIVTTIIYASGGLLSIKFCETDLLGHKNLDLMLRMMRRMYVDEDDCVRDMGKGAFNAGRYVIDPRYVGADTVHSAPSWMSGHESIWSDDLFVDDCQE